MSRTTAARKAQAMAPASPRRAHWQAGWLKRMDSRSKKDGSRTSWLAALRSCRASRTLFSTSRASTDKNSRVDTAFTSGVIRFFVME